VRGIVALLEEACGRNIVGVIFFGSRLVGTSPEEASAADLFVVVENYLLFYEAIGTRLPTNRHTAIMAALNRTLPPNIIYLNDPGRLRAGAKVLHRQRGRSCAGTFTGCEGSLLPWTAGAAVHRPRALGEGPPGRSRRASTRPGISRCHGFRCISTDRLAFSTTAGA
jgi:hypothetical protein